MQRKSASEECAVDADSVTSPSHSWITHTSTSDRSCCQTVRVWLRAQSSRTVPRWIANLKIHAALAVHLEHGGLRCAAVNIQKQIAVLISVRTGNRMARSFVTKCATEHAAFQDCTQHALKRMCSGLISRWQMFLSNAACGPRTEHLRASARDEQ